MLPTPGNVCDLQEFILSKLFPSHTSRMCGRWFLLWFCTIFGRLGISWSLKILDLQLLILSINILGYISHLIKLCPGFLSLSDFFLVYNILSLSSYLCTFLKIFTILWHRSIFSRVKVNTDSLATLRKLWSNFLWGYL